MRTRKLAATVAALATVALIATACSGGGEGAETTSGAPTTDSGQTSDGPAPAQGAVLTIGMPNGPQPENHNPLAPTGSASKSLGYAWAIYESLQQVNEMHPLDPPTPWLATSVEWNDDFTEATIVARDGVTWSDGEAFTADDIAFTFNLMKDHPALNVDFPEQIDGAIAEGDTATVTFNRGQYVNQIKLNRSIIVPEHVWSGIEKPEEYTDLDPVGTGPFLLDTWTPQAVTLVPNESYWGGAPKVAKLQYSSYNDNNALITALTTGEAQWGWTFIADYQDVYIAQDPEHFHQVAGGGFGVDVLFLNNETKPFDDKAFRKALDMSIDREQISVLAGSGVWPGISSVTGMPMPSGEAFLDPALAGKEYSVDVEGAKALLTDAGYTWDGAGKLVDPDGEPVSFELVNPAGWNDYLTALEIIKQGAESLGATATVNAANQDAWFNDIIPFGNFQASLHWTDGGATPWNMYSNMMDGAQYVPLGETANWNFGRYQNDEVTAALADFAAASTDEARMEAIHAVQQRYVEDVPALVIWARPAVAQYSSQNYTGWPTDEDPYTNPQPTGPQAALILSKLVPAA